MLYFPIDGRFVPFGCNPPCAPWTCMDVDVEASASA